MDWKKFFGSIEPDKFVPVPDTYRMKMAHLEAGRAMQDVRVYAWRWGQKLGARFICRWFDGDIWVKRKPE